MARRNKTIPFPQCRLHKVTATAREGAHGHYCRGVIHLKGEMAAALAKRLGVEDSFKNPAISEFQIPGEKLSDFDPDSRNYSMQLLSMNSRSVQLSVGVVSVYAIKCKRGGGEVSLSLQMAFDSRVGRAVNEFCWDTPGWCGYVEIAPTQEALDFDPTDDDEPEEEEQPEAA